MARLPQILVVDDEWGMLELARVSLEARGFLVLVAGAGEAALQRAREELPELILLDLGLPDLDGLEVLRQLRVASTISVIVVTLRADEATMIRALEMGAANYVTKPFSAAELAARIRAVLRRCAAARDRSPAADFVAVDKWLQIDFGEREVVVAGRRIPLRPTEYRLLYHLVQNSGHTLPFETILARVWGPEYRAETQYVHLYVTYLRQKIEPAPRAPRYVLTRRGVGYRFCPLSIGH